MIKLAEQYDDLPINQVIHGDALAVLKSLPDNSIDALVTDPPAGIKFMGKDWDANKGDRKQWQAWLCQIMIEALRVLKPGGHAYVWALPRTSHWTATALEDAGFEIRDCVVHLHGQGFPKNHNISKSIDKRLGAERTEVVGRQKATGNARGKGAAGHYANDIASLTGKGYEIVKDGWDITAPATPEALAHEGEGTALKPASEHWWLCRKPLSEPTIAENVLKWGTGGLNIDKTRITGIKPLRETQGEESSSLFGFNSRHPSGYSKQGRWPANVVMSHSLFCIPNGTKRVKPSNGSGTARRSNGVSTSAEGWGNIGKWKPGSSDTGYADSEGYEEIEDWECSDDCPVKLLGRQSGTHRNGGIAGKHYTSNGDPATSVYGGNIAKLSGRSFSDEGTAARYFHNFSPEPFLYAAKPSRRERNQGLENLPEIASSHNLSSNACSRCGLRVKANGSGKKCECGDLRETMQLPVKGNIHPTVKSQSIMRHLIRQITPAGGIVLDCFAGSGSTCVAAIAEGYQFIGIEMNDTPDEPYVTIARARIEQSWKQVASE